MFITKCDLFEIQMMEDVDIFPSSLIFQIPTAWVLTKQIPVSGR